MMSCPLCNHDGARQSWLGSTLYGEREFSYLECSFCHSLYCSPMPDEQTLARMYGVEYATAVAADPAAGDDSKEPARVVERLAEERPGTFVDYGCGEGHLLTEAARLGWRALGVEFDREVACAVEKRTGARVVTVDDLDSLGYSFADVLHLGDVIEHLTKMDKQMPKILELLKPGGLLLAQGPLEGNTTLFNSGLRLARAFRPQRKLEMAPYHVLLATASGQRALFERLGLKEESFTVREVSWPAPTRLSSATLRQPRSVGLFLLRRLSQTATKICPAQWGNRYFYAGRREA